MTRRAAREQSLPEEEVSLLSTLPLDTLRLRCKQLYQAGWTLRAIGEATTPPRSRSTVRTWVTQVEDPDSEPHPSPVPVPEFRTTPEYVKIRPPSPGIPADAMKIIETAAPLAKRYRSGMSSRSKASQANDLLTKTVKKLYDDGVPVSELASAAGVTYRAMAKRLGKQDSHA